MHKSVCLLFQDTLLAKVRLRLIEEICEAKSNTRINLIKNIIAQKYHYVGSAERSLSTMCHLPLVENGFDQYPSAHI